MFSTSKTKDFQRNSVKLSNYLDTLIGSKEMLMKHSFFFFFYLSGINLSRQKKEFFTDCKKAMVENKK